MIINVSMIIDYNTIWLHLNDYKCLCRWLQDRWWSSVTRHGPIPHPQCAFWRPGSKLCPHTCVDRFPFFETSLSSRYFRNSQNKGFPKKSGCIEFPIFFLFFQKFWIIEIPQNILDDKTILGCFITRKSHKFI